MINLDIRISIIGQNENNIIVEFSIPDEWSNIQEIAKTATMQEFIELYECITPDTVQDFTNTIVMKNSFNQ